MTPSGTFKTGQNHKKCKNVPTKMPSQSRPATRPPLEEAKPRKLTIVAHFQHFFHTHRGTKKRKIGAKMEPQGHQNQTKKRKNEHTKKLQKNSTAENRFLVHSGVVLGLLFRTGNVPQITAIAQKPQYGPPNL